MIYKRLLCLMVIFITLANVTIVLGDDNELYFLEQFEVVNKDCGDKECLSRYDCLRGVLTAAGMRVDGFYDGADGMEPIFEDETLFKMGEGREYIYFGGMYGIAAGEPNFGGKPFFKPNDNASVNTCIVFIMRCLEDTTGYSLNDILTRAEERGLVLSTDDFYRSGDIELTYEMFCVLISRMLEQKRYIYFTDENVNKNLFIYDGLQYDNDGEMTYYQYLETSDYILRDKLPLLTSAEAEMDCVLRLNCLIAVLKEAGMENNNFYDAYCNNHYVSYEPTLYDEDEVDFGKGREYMLLGKWYNIIGKENLDHATRFKPYEKADVGSCAAFIIRCLEDVPKFETGNEAMEYIYDRAKDRGLIKEYDEFYDNPDELLTYERLCILLNRMLFEKRYIYFTEEHYNENNGLLLTDGKNYDNEGEMTYLDFVKTLYYNNIGAVDIIS